MSTTLRPPLLSDEQLSGVVTFPGGGKRYEHEMAGDEVRDFYERARAKDAWLIQRLVDAIAYSRKHGPPVSLSNSHWDIALHNALYEAAEAGFKPSEP